MRRPNFFIVGAPRCGTTALWTYLKAHPEIFMSSQKELYYFDSDLRPEGWTQPSLEQYLSNFASAGDRGLVGEATPSYLRSERAPHAKKALFQRWLCPPFGMEVGVKVVEFLLR